MRMHCCTASRKQRLTWIPSRKPPCPQVVLRMRWAEALVLAGRVSELSNAATPEQHAVALVLVTPFNVAKPSDAGIFEEEGTAIPVVVAWMVTRHTLGDETTPLVTSCTTMRSVKLQGRAPRWEVN